MHKTCPASLSMAIWVTFGAMGAPALAQGFPQDWSHRQVRFSHPGPAPDQRDRSAHERWSKIINEPRFAIQSKRFQAAASNRLPNNLLHSGRHRRLVTPQRDWQMNMYSAATTVARNGAGRYPVTWSLDPTAPACDSAAHADRLGRVDGPGSARENQYGRRDGEPEGRTLQGNSSCQSEPAIPSVISPKPRYHQAALLHKHHNLSERCHNTQELSR